MTIIIVTAPITPCQNRLPVMSYQNQLQEKSRALQGGDRTKREKQKSLAKSCLPPHAEAQGLEHIPQSNLSVQEMGKLVRTLMEQINYPAVD